MAQPKKNPCGCSESCCCAGMDCIWKWDGDQWVIFTDTCIAGCPGEGPEISDIDCDCLALPTFPGEVLVVDQERMGICAEV